MTVTERIQKTAQRLRIESLYICAERFGFRIDTRGTHPVMIQGLRAMEYRRYRDLLNFISIRHETLIQFGCKSAENFVALRDTGYFGLR